MTINSENPKSHKGEIRLPRVTIFILLGIVLVVLIAFVMFCVLIFLYFSGGVVNEESNDNNVYQISTLNPSGNQTNSVGFAKIERELSEEEYLSFSNPKTGSTTIISNFFDSEYECTGTCYCDEEKNLRRNSASVFNRGMFIVLTALTASMAVNIAKETFENDCKKKLENVCNEFSIKSDVENCDEVQVEAGLVSENKEKNGAVAKKKNEPQQHRKTYYCRGHCLQYSKHLWRPADDKSEDPAQIARKDFGDCQKLEMTGRVSFVVPFHRQFLKQSNTKARKVFRASHLKQFCVAQSLVSVEVEVEKGQFKVLDTPACSASYHNSQFIKNIKCKLEQNKFY